MISWIAAICFLLHCTSAADPQPFDKKNICDAAASHSISDAAGVLVSPNYPLNNNTAMECISTLDEKSNFATVTLMLIELFGTTSSSLYFLDSKGDQLYHLTGHNPPKSFSVIYPTPMKI